MPRVVAVIGASSNREKFGNKALRAFQAEGFEVVPVNPHEAVIEGLRSYRSVLDVPHAIDMATVYVPPDIGIGLLPELERKQVPEIWFNPGAESDDLLAEARRLKLNVIVACSIVGIGRSPYQF